MFEHSIKNIRTIIDGIDEAKAHQLTVTQRKGLLYQMARLRVLTAAEEMEPAEGLDHVIRWGVRHKDYAILHKDDDFTNWFWLRRAVAHRVDDGSVIVDYDDHRTAYMMRPDTGSGMRGFGGAEFIFEDFEGSRVSCRNVWCQGDVPEAFYGVLPASHKHIQKTFS